MCDVKWVRIDTDMFDHPKIKYLRKLPNGDKIVLFWIRLLTMAGKCNAGGKVQVTDGVPYTRAILSYVTDTDIKTLNTALDNFSLLNMISLDGDNITVTGWEEHQNVSGMERIREQTRARVKRHREQQNCNADRNADCNATCNVTVTQSNATDKEEDKNRYKETSTNVDVKKKTAARFSPPSLEDIRSYCSERNNGIDPEAFLDYYSSNGWMVGKNHMRDWKAAVRNWEKKEFRAPGKLQSPQSITTSGTSEPSMEDLDFMQAYLARKEE